ncbi:MAG: amidohydrolase family protein [Candidatus Bathyarchaeia archaeon]
MKIIDYHVHVWSSDFESYPFQGYEHLKRIDASPELLLRCMDEAGVSGALIIQPIPYRWDHRFVTYCLRTWPQRFKGMALINPSDSEAPETLERLVKEEGYVAVRLNPNLYPHGKSLDSEISDRILNQASRLGIAVGFLINPMHFDALDALLTRHSDVDAIIDHFGLCSSKDGGPETNESFRRLLGMARHPRLYVKLSEFPQASTEPYPYRDLHPWVHALLRAFGAERLMWGTDFPYIMGQCGYKKGLQVLKNEIQGISFEEMEWLLGKTAEKVFGIWG